MKYFHSYTIPLFLIICCLVTGGCNSNMRGNSVHLDIDAKPLEKISYYNFFKYCCDFTKPNKGVVRYKLINTMFNDYSKSETFMYIPDGLSLRIDSSNLLDIPVGGCLINIVYYLKDERNPSSQKQLIETQLLIRKQTGWGALNYRWNEDQKDAGLFNTSGSEAVNLTDKNGLAQQINFQIVPPAECKNCHLRGNQFFPIGIKTGNLNTDADYPTGKKNQLDHWADAGLLKHFAKESIVTYPNWRDTSVSIDQRARAYLNANCAHCHSPGGQAFASGLFLNTDNNNNLSYGMCKPPLSKGKGTCYLNYDIVPGKPSESAMVCRMASNEEGVKMPEYGRTVVDTEGLSLITSWIAHLNTDCKQAK